MKQNPSTDFIKDPYDLEFLGIPESHDILEKDIEQAIVSNLQKFLLEMGKGVWHEVYQELFLFKE